MAKTGPLADTLVRVSPDPDAYGFVDLLELIIKSAGGVTALARATGIGVGTLRQWRRGQFPTDRVTAPIDRVDSWASKNMPAPYPPPGFPSGGLQAFIARSGRGNGATESDREPEPEDEPKPMNKWRVPRRMPLVVIATLAVAATLAVLGYLQLGLSSSTELVGGNVSCLSGRDVVGVFVGAGANTSGFADYTQTSPGTATYIFNAPTGVPYAVHVGCGGTKDQWLTDNRSEHYPGISNSFVCDDRIDVVHGQKYGRCALS